MYTCCPLHKYQHVPNLVAIVDYIHVYMFPTTQVSARAKSCCYCGLHLCKHVSHYTSISTCQTLLLLLTAFMYTCCPLHKYQHVPNLVAIVDCIYVYMLPTTQVSAHTVRLYSRISYGQVFKVLLEKVVQTITSCGHALDYLEFSEGMDL